jgi:hypothetical protein
LVPEETFDSFTESGVSNKWFIVFVLLRFLLIFFLLCSFLCIFLDCFWEFEVKNLQKHCLPYIFLLPNTMIVDELSQIVLFLVETLLVDPVAPRDGLQVERWVLVFIESVLKVKYLRNTKDSRDCFVVDVFFVDDGCQ